MVSMIKNNEIKIFPNADILFEFAVNDFIQRVNSTIQKKDIFSVVLSGGSTPKLFFDLLANNINNIPWQKIQFFFGDERYVSLNDAENNYHMAYEHLFSKIPVNPA